MALVKFNFKNKPREAVSFICFSKDGVTFFDENWKQIGSQDRTAASLAPETSVKKEKALRL